MDQAGPRWVPTRLRPGLRKPWVKALLVVAVFAALAGIFMLVSERKDSSYWAGYVDGQRWVHEGGYQAHEQSITAYCRGTAGGQQNPGKFEHGCIDGAHNAMK